MLFGQALSTECFSFLLAHGNCPFSNNVKVRKRNGAHYSLAIWERLIGTLCFSTIFNSVRVKINKPLIFWKHSLTKLMMNKYDFLTWFSKRVAKSYDDCDRDVVGRLACTLWALLWLETSRARSSKSYVSKLYSLLH